MVSIDAAELVRLRAAAAVPQRLANEFRNIAKTAQKGVKGQILRLANMAERSADGAVSQDAPPLSVKDIIGALHGKSIPALTIKAGRVLSSTNEASLTQARDLIDGVIQQVATDDDDLETRAAALRMLELKSLEFTLA